MKTTVEGDHFEWSYTEEPHASRRTEMLDKYPHIKQYFGIDHSFKYVVVAMVAVEFLYAWLLKDSDWLLVALQAYFVGGTISHSLSLAVHEISHNMAFGCAYPLANRIFGFVANMPMFVPISISFKKYHDEHHRYMGVDMIDTDIPTEFEARLFKGTIGKLIWMILQPFFYAFRPFSVYKKAVMDLEIINALFQVVVDYLVIMYMGPKAVAFLLAGFLVSCGLHPLAGHYVSEHYVLTSKQETYSHEESTFGLAVMDLEIINALFQVVVDYLVIMYMGPKAVAFLLAGFLVSCGLHPLAGHYVSEHYVLTSKQETYSYYGPINLVTFNVGYHNEHHDFPFVCGRNLSKIREIAPEYYHGLMAHDSLLRAMYNFVSDPKITLHSRIKRNLVRPSDMQFYGVGPNSSCVVHKFIESLINMLFGRGTHKKLD
ncbi:Sphingolipid delta(4)-desaturase DES1 [Toxocara canis]|uniref:Sphingolipid delta(4)-desaturase DES1 n=1 Tax=Toxocara canis TaxID=6265 RepID=A0A0B2V9M0_TOXCA|nr:Sphingolipid delta(4)-desaturase DES1 [Toxocara canis]